MPPSRDHPAASRTITWGPRRPCGRGALRPTLADPSRARIVHLLAIAEHELCVCDIALVLGDERLGGCRTSFGSSESAAQWIGARPAVIVYYRLIDDHLRDLVLGAAIHVAEGR